LIGNRKIELKIIGIRPGEKIHEVLVSDEEADRTIERNGYYVIRPMLPELCDAQESPIGLSKEYSSADNVMSVAEASLLLHREGLMPEHQLAETEEVLR